MTVKANVRERLTAALDAALAGFRAAPAKAAPDFESSWRLLADGAADLITRHSPDGRIRFASAAAESLLGRKPQELEGVTPDALVHPDDLAAVQALFRDASYFGRPGRAPARLIHADGGIVWAELSLCRTGLDGQGGGDIVAVTRDIGAFRAESDALMARSAALQAQCADLAEARNAALAATAAKSRFLANMSHELRTPLNAIIGFSEVMGREMFGALGAPRYREYAGLIEDSGRHLLELINGLLDMSKIEAGKFEIYEEMFDLGETVESALRIVALAAERADVTLSFEGEAGMAFADRRAIRQMLVNLLSNAIKFTLPGGRIILSVRSQASALMLAVADNGTGIAAADLERLGRPFEQAGHGREGAGREGTGLGLALVKALAALHGGEAVIQSVLGEGTTVTVRLPHAAVDTAPQAAGRVVRFRGAA
jgi:cell cycle sensor histidine kinase DivJ